MPALLVSLAAAQFMAGEPLAVKRRYMHDLRGVSCSISAPGGAVAWFGKFGEGASVQLPASALVVVGEGAIDKDGEPWVKVRRAQTPAQSGWVDLKDLSCV